MLTADKHIVCRGWVVPEPVPEWTSSAIYLSNEIHIPFPSATQVLVKVHAAGVNPVDCKRVTFPAFTIVDTSSENQEDENNANTKEIVKEEEETEVSKLPGFPFPYVAGVDGAGEVVAIGSDVTNFSVGDRVVFHSDLTQSLGGSLCEFALVEHDVLVQIPLRNIKIQNSNNTGNRSSKVDEVEKRKQEEEEKKMNNNNSSSSEIISYEEAAAIPCAGWTAYLALFDKLRVETGRSIFIHGASGGVGSIAIQLARYYGLYVFASCSPENAMYVQGLGAHVVLDYHDPEGMINAILQLTEQSKCGSIGVDYMLDLANDNLSEMRLAALRFGGSVCMLNGLLVPATGALFARQLSVHYVFMGAMHGQAYTRPLLRELGEKVMKLYSKGVFHLAIEVEPFEAAAEVLNRLATHHGARGKVVVQINHYREEKK